MSVIDDDFVTALSEHLLGMPDVALFRLAYIPLAPRVQRRVSDDAIAESVIEQARELRRREGIPFWHALFLRGEDTAEGLPRSIADAALFHQDVRTLEEAELELDEQLPARLRDLIDSCPEGRILSLTSRVTMVDGGEYHIPMLDFSTKSLRLGGEQSARTVVQSLGLPGLLVASGRSFHFFGAVPLPSTDAGQWLVRALLLSPITDERWIAHQMLSGVSSLRVSRGTSGDLPRPLGIVEVET